MPASLTSSFASAAAGNNSDNAGASRRGEGSGEWSRTRTNGATQTFRRPSVATTSSHTRDSSSNISGQPLPAGAYIPPHLNANFQSNSLRNGGASEGRYSKDQLLDLYKGQRDAAEWNKKVTDIFMASWNPLDANSPANGSGAWGKRDDHKDNSLGPEICWDHGGQVEPLGLISLNDEEKELFDSSVNSPLKAPPQSGTKEGATHGGTSNRKTSVSQSLGNANLGSPSASRPSNRRRETGDSTAASNPLSPSGNTRFFRDEGSAAAPPPSLLRRKTDFKDTGSEIKQEERDTSFAARDSEHNSPFNTLKRAATGPLSAGLNGPTSPWPSGASSAGFAPMGAFGSFSLASNNPQTPSGDKKPGYGSLRGESRFKGLLSKESSEDLNERLKEKSSLGNLGRLLEDDDDEPRQPWEDETRRSRHNRSDTNPFGGEGELRSGSAALGGAQDNSPPTQGIDRLGFSAFGNAPSLRDLMQGQSQDQGQRRTPLGQRHQEPMSPTDTNPYQSPSVEKTEGEDAETDGSDSQQPFPSLSGLREELGIGSGAFNRKGISTPADISAAGDRSQTSSVGPGRGFPAIGGIGGFSDLGGGWPQSAGPIGTPSRERSAFGPGFGDPIFGGGTMGGLQSPSLAALGGGGFFGSPSLSGAATLPRTSKMGSLFPAAMQEQMRQEVEGSDRKMTGSVSLEDSLRRDTNAQLRGGNMFNEFGGLDIGSRLMRGTDEAGFSDTGSLGASGAVNMGQGSGFPHQGMPIDANHQPGQNLSQSTGSASSNQMPAAQQRQMVMPDRMRWIYRDPQGNTQGPWSGLEMHDWFKAGFFTAELQVKKLEDTEYEPLAQLVRRIGNSREPFLVPQIGVPHGPEPKQPTPWGTTTQTGSAQPPFASSFPSFGTTLTAEQQNALERRKQEEQYLMARQKEHLAAQQAMMKQIPFTGAPHAMHSHQLQHHSSAHSLHSQPSFGSITSPTGYQPSPLQNPVQPLHGGPGFFDSPMRHSQLPNIGHPLMGADAFGGPPREEEVTFMDRINAGRAGQPQSATGPSYGARQQAQHSQQVSSVLQDRMRLQQGQDQFDKLQLESQADQPEKDERLRQFEALRAQTEEDSFDQSPQAPVSQPIGAASSSLAPETHDEDFIASRDQPGDAEASLSLTQRVQKAAAAQQVSESSQEFSWAKPEPAAMPQPFPPAPSMSPLPAPAAQRRHIVADNLVTESRSQTQTPAETLSTSLAPWAKEANEGTKKPSLKEIQEAEAREAAKEEEIAAAARRALLEQERQALAAQTAPAPGLPSSSTWGSGSAAAPVSTGAPWAKPGAKAPVAAATTAKKTLSQIQKEEESVKLRLAAASAAQTMPSGPSPVTGTKSYANLAGKISAPTGPAALVSAGSGAWTTVGAGGKTKTPAATPTPAIPVGPRAVSGSVPTLATPKPRPAAVTRTTASQPSAVAPSNASKATQATQELVKWAKGALGNGLNNDINVDDFVQQLCILPNETEIISDSVYANSQTLDGRRFAEEYVRRRRLAEKGQIDPTTSAGINGSSSSQSSSGGWSEVAKKGPASTFPKEDQSTQAFKVVAAKKKGRK